MKPDGYKNIEQPLRSNTISIGVIGFPVRSWKNPFMHILNVYDKASRKPFFDLVITIYLRFMRVLRGANHLCNLTTNVGLMMSALTKMQKAPWLLIGRDLKL